MPARHDPLAGRHPGHTVPVPLARTERRKVIKGGGGAKLLAEAGTELGDSFGDAALEVGHHENSTRGVRPRNEPEGVRSTSLVGSHRHGLQTTRRPWMN